MRNKRGVLLGDGDSLYMSDEKDRADEHVSMNTISVMMTERADKIRAMDVCWDYSADAPIEKN